jgi:hypothetical protein
MSPSKNLYIADSDVPIWEEAERTAKNMKTSLSKVISDVLRRHLPRADPFRVVVNGAISGEIQFTDDHRPILDYADHHPHGRGWLLWYQNPSNGGLEMRFIGGDSNPPAAAAEEWLKQIAPKPPIRVEIGDPNIPVEFDGMWLVEPDRDETRTGEDGYDAGAYYGVALTGRGRIAVYIAHINERWAARLEDFDSFDQAASVTPPDILALAAKELGMTRPIRRDI